MISPIQLTPNMDVTTMVNAINSNFQQAASENRVKVMRDENGVDRLLLGRAPDGTYVLAITVPGKSVIEELEK